MIRSILLIKTANPAEIVKLAEKLGLVFDEKSQEFKLKDVLNPNISETFIGYYNETIILTNGSIPMNFIQKELSDELEGLRKEFKLSEIIAIYEYMNQIYFLATYRFKLERLRKYIAPQYLPPSGGIMEEIGYTGQEYELTKEGGMFYPMTPDKLLSYKYNFELNNKLIESFILEYPTEELFNKIKMTRYVEIG